MTKKESNTNIVSAVAAYRNQNKTREVRKENVIHNSNKKVDNKEKVIKSNQNERVK